MKGTYVYLTQDGITHVRWFRTPEKAEKQKRDWFYQSGDEAQTRGEITDPRPVAK